jgi:hypothetical protein
MKYTCMRLHHVILWTSQMTSVYVLLMFLSEQLVSNVLINSCLLYFLIIGYRDSGYMMAPQRRCLRCLSVQLLLCQKNLSCNWQKYQATLFIGGTPLFQTVDVNSHALVLCFVQYSSFSSHQHKCNIFFRKMRLSE